MEAMLDLQVKLAALRDDNQTQLASLTESQMETTELEIRLDDLVAQNQGKLMKMESVDKKLLEEMVKIQAKLAALQDENQTLLASLTKSQMEATGLKVRIDQLGVQNQSQSMAMEGESKKLLEETVKLQARLTALQDNNRAVSASLTRSRLEATKLKVRLAELGVSGRELQNLTSLLDGFIRMRLSEEPSGIINIMGKVAAVKDPELKYKMYAAFESIDTPAEDELMIDLMKHLSSKIENLAGGGVSLNIQAKLNCDEVLRSQLVFQRGATAKSRIQAVIAQVQFHEPECARDVWKPVAIDMSATTGLCYRSSKGYTTAGTQLKVGGQALPESLQRTVGGNQTPRYTSGRDSENNIIVYWADNTADRPSDAASCWLYYSDLRTWHGNFFQNS